MNALDEAERASGQEAVLRLAPTEEEVVRRSVAAIAARFGRTYLATMTDEGSLPTELGNVRRDGADAVQRWSTDPRSRLAQAQIALTLGERGLALECGLTDLWWLARLFRIAPIPLEMILNTVAERVLGLPKSY